MKTLFQLSSLLFLLSFMGIAHAKSKPTALVWSGPGACRPSCVLDAAHAARKAGFKVKFVNQHLKDFSVFKTAKVWVQPGGHSVTVAAAMSNAMISEIKDFVFNGGGYVGFCAGLFIATNDIGTSGKPGYGIIPGETELWVEDGKPENQMLKIATTYFGSRWILYAGGPYIKISEQELKSINGEVIARYPNGDIGGIRGQYGKGKVAVVGFHPEADIFWKAFKGKIDRDGSDVFFAVDMIKFTTTP